MTAALELLRVPRVVPDWHRQAACRAFPGLNFADPGNAGDSFNRAPDAATRRLHTAACRIVCSTCPFRLPCAVGALERREKHGMWGGLDYEDRKRVAAQYGYLPPGDPPAHGTPERRKKWGCTCPECKAAHALYEAQRRERKRAQRPPFARRLAELRTGRGWTTYRQVAEAAGLSAYVVRSLELGETAPTADRVTALVRAFTLEDGPDRARLAEELHQLAGTAIGATEVAGRRVLVMAGSRHDLEVRHLKAMPRNVCTGHTLQLRPDRPTWRRRIRHRQRNRP